MINQIVVSGRVEVPAKSVETLSISQFCRIILPILRLYDMLSGRKSPSPPLLFFLLFAFSLLAIYWVPQNDSNVIIHAELHFHLFCTLDEGLNLSIIACRWIANVNDDIWLPSALALRYDLTDL